MSDEERRDSLADQAAAWVPPWARPRPPATDPSAPPDEPAADTDEPGAAPALPDAESAAGPGEPDLGPAEPDPHGVASDEVDAAATEVGAVTPPTAGPDLGAVTEDTAGESGAAGDVPRRQSAGRRRATAAPEPAPELSDAELRGALEAILLVVDEPVSELVLAQVLDQPAERVGPMLDEIAAGYTTAGHGFELRRAAGGWRLYTRPEYATYVERFVLDGQSVRLTQAALETLAVVAYKQPVTRSRISAIRGVNCDGVIRTLVTRGLVEECGTEQDSGAFLYRTTTLFLEKLGLNTVDELPPLAPFLPDDVEELADATR
ncbi:SMC-Scp complex subunit ScpB [Micromonospora sp. DH14]|uniref:SMC-Scp complex subunit ScpB n=1 Tax=Micromonospora sp. DH14 TaxID=3040120 RepID=UPI002442DFF2|nr:SMC-Scp complex subunit ScpB [Micromonospora sp. DH14]MDG9678350.1 SMC-Scp complex subunit ScpB [Micromonospora sp. DH14]